jgi:cobalamin biosynthesis protein CobT
VPNLSVYAVGIQSDAVNRYYKNRCTINNAHELEEKLLEVVRDQIITGE